jgi:hypothetical protein
MSVWSSAVGARRHKISHKKSNNQKSKLELESTKAIKTHTFHFFSSVQYPKRTNKIYIYIYIIFYFRP